MTYKTKGTCSQMIEFEITDGKVHNVKFTGGCNGNLKGIGQLVEGMDAEEVIKRLEGTTCGFKSTSCPDQLAAALKEYLKDNLRYFEVVIYTWYTSDIQVVYTRFY